MNLTDNLIKNFVDSTNDKEKKSEESTVYGTVSIENNIIHVRFDGSEISTPASTTTAIKTGDRVLTRVKDHKVTIIGNLTDLSASSSSVNESRNDVTVIKNAVIGYGHAEDFDVARLTFQNGIANQFTADEIETLTLAFNKATGGSLSLDNLNAALAEFQAAITGSLTADQIKAASTIFESSVVKQLYVDSLDAGYAKIDFANIDFSEVNIAKIGELFSEAGIINDLTTESGTVTGELVGVTIKGDLIEGNTVVAEKLVIKGEDGLFYKLNTDSIKEDDPEFEQTVYNALDGSNIIAKSITASKISVSDLVAFGATIGGLRIENGSIHSVGKTGVDSQSRGIYMDSVGQFATGDANNFIASWYDTVEEKWKVAIRAEDISFGTGENVRDVITNAASMAATMMYDHTYVLFDDNGVQKARFTAYLYEGKTDVKNNYEPAQFLWYKKTETNDPLNTNEEGLELLGTGYTIDIPVSQIGYRGTIVGKFSSLNDTPLIEEGGQAIGTESGETITGRTEATGFVKVSELPLDEPVLSDKLMGIGSEQEYQMTIQDLKNLIGGAMSYNELSDKPKIEGVTLQGDKTYEELNLEAISNFDIEFMLT